MPELAELPQAEPEIESLPEAEQDAPPQVLDEAFVAG